MFRETELEMVTRHVEQSAKRIDRQKKIVELKRQSGWPTALSEDVLKTLEATQVLHRKHLDRLQKPITSGQTVTAPQTKLTWPLAFKGLSKLTSGEH